MKRVGILQLAHLETLSSSLFPLILDFFLVGGGGATQKRGGIPFPRQGQKDMTSAWRFKGFPSASFSCRDH